MLAGMVPSMRAGNQSPSWGKWGAVISLATPGDRRKVRLMKIKGVVTLAAIVVLSRCPAGAQIYDTNNVVVQTFAGSGFAGYLDGQGTQTMFNNPNVIVADSHSNLFVWDVNNYRIRKIAPHGTVTTFAGGGDNAHTGVGTNVNLGNFLSYNITSIAIDPNDTIWMVNERSSLIYEITSGAAVTDIDLFSSGLGGALGICADSTGNIYISAGNAIYRYNTNGVLSVFAGSGNSGAIDGNGVFTSFTTPTALAADAADNIYVWDSGNRKIRRINQNRDVVTITGGSATSTDGQNPSFNAVSSICVDGVGNLILACGASVRKMSVTTNGLTLAGSFTQTGYTNGAGNLARFNGASGVCMSGGTIYVADTSNQRIRQIGLNPTPVIRRQPQPQISCLGQSASFQVTADGVQPLFYQWLSNSVPIAGQTSTNLVLTNLVASQAGAYSVIVSNSFNAVTSAPAQLVVNDACVGVQLYAGLNMSGQPGATYLLSYTTNLNAPLNWIPLATNTMPVSGWLYIDTNSPFTPQRFYRAQLSP